MKIAGLRTVALRSAHIKAAERFYCAVLGGQLVSRSDPTPEEQERGRVAEIRIRLGEVQMSLFDASAGEPRGVPHHTLVSAWLEQEVAVEHFQTCGITIESVRVHPDQRGYSLYVHDPDGHRLELWFHQDD